MPAPPRGVRRVREQIAWIADEDLNRLEEKGELSAASLSLLTGGGGQLYVGDYRQGFALLSAQAATFAVAVGVTPWALLPFLGLGVFSAVSAWRKARALNRYLAAKREEYERQNPHPAAYRLLAAMSAVDPTAVRDAMEIRHFAGPVGAPAQALPAGRPAGTGANPGSPAQELAERLRKAAAIRDAGAITVEEHRGRKVEILERAFSGVERDSLDDTLYELLPLLEEGVIDREDVEFIKQLVGV